MKEQQWGIDKMQRRDLFKMAWASTAGSMAFCRWAETKAALAAPEQLEYGAADLAGWEVVLGDGLYATPGQAPVTLADIATFHKGNLSELRANTQRRGIMAHNITFNRKIDTTALNYTHLCEYEFRLPFMPRTNNTTYNAQTLEASFAIWDGSGTRLDYIIAIQWVLNPWLSSFGAIRYWTSVDGGSWQTSGYLAPDTKWHRLKMVFDYRYQATAIVIDDRHYLSGFAATAKPATWGTETAARLGAEIVSLYPGNNSTAPMHLAEFRNWHWVWTPSA